jgi:hypothetical protein
VNIEKRKEKNHVVKTRKFERVCCDNRKKKVSPRPRDTTPCTETEISTLRRKRARGGLWTEGKTQRF